MKIAIVTDSTSDLLQETVQQYDIKVLPLKVVYSETEEYKDRIEITPEQIYERFERQIPTTSLPSIEETMNLFKSLEEEGHTHIIVTTISGGLSGTINMVQTVAKDFENLTFEIIDSKALTMGLGFPVIEGAKEREKSNDFEKVVKKIKDTIENTEVYFIVKTLEYLKRGGRIGRVEGTIGDILNIKPLISINDQGVYYTLKKVRGRAKSIKELYELVQQKASEKMVNIAVAHGNAYEEAYDLLEKIKEFKNVKNVVLTQLSPVMVVHSGPGLIGVVISEYNEV
jgi:DegV family protein with EDD domain